MQFQEKPRFFCPTLSLFGAPPPQQSQICDFCQKETRKKKKKSSEAENFLSLHVFTVFVRVTCSKMRGRYCWVVVDSMGKWILRFLFALCFFVSLFSVVFVPFLFPPSVFCSFSFLSSSLVQMRGEGGRKKGKRC